MEEKKLQALKDFFKKNHITQISIAEKTGMSQPQINRLLKGKDEFGKKTSEVFANAYGFNPLWLMTGNGNMMLESDSENSKEVLMLPVINLDTRAGLAINEVADTPEFITETMPFSRSVARDGDFVMPVIGESMTPRYPNGTYVLVRPLPTWREYIELGAAYVLELADGRRLIKEIRAGSDAEHFTLHSVNPTFDPSEIAKNFIAHIFAVIVSVRRDYNW